MLRHTILALLLWLSAALGAMAAGDNYPGALADRRIAKGAGHIREAWLADATTRYRHFVLGSQYEAVSLVVRLRDGDLRTLSLPHVSVFEDRQPRLADIDGDGRDDIVLVKSTLGRGASLVVVSLVKDQLEIIAETPPTGSQNTWLNPAGIADFDGDGRLDIAYVQMPHVLGRLRVWTMRAGQLVEIATLEDTSNHKAGAREIGLSAVADFDGDGVMDLAVPSLDRKTLRFIRFKGGVRELARKPLPSPALTDFALETAGGKPAVIVGLGGGKTIRIAP
jgi:FG-GAP-like repeat